MTPCDCSMLSRIFDYDKFSTIGPIAAQTDTTPHSRCSLLRGRLENPPRRQGVETPTRAHRKWRDNRLVGLLRWTRLPAYGFGFVYRVGRALNSRSMREFRSRTIWTILR